MGDTICQKQNQIVRFGPLRFTHRLILNLKVGLARELLVKKSKPNIRIRKRTFLE